VPRTTPASNDRTVRVCLRTERQMVAADVDSTILAMSFCIGFRLLVEGN
jgi:hypothetical protein